VGVLHRQREQKCKCPEVGKSPGCLNRRKESSVATAQKARERKTMRGLERQGAARLPGHLWARVRSFVVF